MLRACRLKKQETACCFMKGDTLTCADFSEAVFLIKCYRTANFFSIQWRFIREAGFEDGKNDRT